MATVLLSLLFKTLVLIAILNINESNAKGLFPLNFKDAIQTINHMKIIPSNESFTNEFLQTSKRVDLQMSSFSSLITMKTVNITKDCSKQLSELEYALRKRELWALQGKIMIRFILISIIILSFFTESKLLTLSGNHQAGFSVEILPGLANLINAET